MLHILYTSYVGFCGQSLVTCLPFRILHPQPPKQKRLRNSWLPSPKMVSCSNKIRRFGDASGGDLATTCFVSHPEKLIVDEFS